MKKTKKLLVLLTVIAMAISMCAGLAGCNGTGNTGDDGNQGQNPSSGENVNYTVTVKTAGGMAMEGISVTVYTDEALTKMQNTMNTDASGLATLSMPKDGQYYIGLTGVPKGYELQSYYTFSGTTAQITLSSALVQDGNLSEVQLNVGDVMYDFTVTAPDGIKYTLSEMLKDKKMALINFWYTGCSWCITEFPFMEKAYQMYKDDVAIVAVDPMNEGDAAISAFPAANGLELSFPLASCPVGWPTAFAIDGYPTSVVVDRYGVIVLIERGAIPSLRPFTCLFEALTADDYQQQLYSSIGDVYTIPKPAYEMADSDTVANILGTTDLEISFRPEEGEDGEYSWPFIEAEKNGETCLMASNKGMDDSFAILYADVTLQAGQALGFDYLSSTNAGMDYMAVIVDEELVFQISGYNDVEKWESCYPVVADKDGTYEVALCFLMDEYETEEELKEIIEDTVYIKNMRIVDAKNIDTETYLPRQAASTEDGFTYTYADIVYNESDGCYHVGSKNGPLLLVDLMNATQFSEETSIWLMAYNGDIKVNGVDYVDQIEQYSNYANNSSIYGACAVDQELYDLLKIVDQAVGFDDDDDMEWMKACKYYQNYGTKNQLGNPVQGLAPAYAYTAKQGKNVSTNFFYYDRVIMPRGLYAEFIPSRSGVYRITSRNEYGELVDGWIFNENREILMEYEADERMYSDENEVSMVFYMEAGKPYYINIAFRDLYAVGYIYYDIAFLGATYNHFRSCSPGVAFTYSTDATGSSMNYTIAPGIDVVLGDDGYYYHDLGGGEKGSMIYADFTSIGLAGFSHPISGDSELQGLIDKGAFDFSKTEYDSFILDVMERNDNDRDKIIEFLKEYWSDFYEEYYELYCVDDVLDGIYHGTGKDYTELMRKYEKKMITSGPIERRGCVAVTEELAEALQLLMDKYTFENVETSWRKLCFYYDYMGQ